MTNVPTWFRVSTRTVVGMLLLPVLVAILVGAACGGGDATKGPLGSLKPTDFPTEPINILVGYDAGGGSDQWARSIAKAAEEVLGVPVTVTNLVGNAGLDALDQYMSEPADGYSLFSIVDLYAAAYASGETEINPAEDLVPLLVGNLVVSQIYMAADEERFSSWEDVVEYGQDNPGLTVASVGSPLDLEGLSIQGLEDDFGLDLERVLFPDAQARFNATIDGTTDLLIEQPSDVIELLDAGQIVPILTLWDQRIKGFEDVPTATELGAGFPPLLRLRGLAAHKDVSQERLTYLEAALREAFNSQEFQDGLKQGSMDLVDYPEDAKAAFEEQVDTYKQLYGSALPTTPRVLIVHSYSSGFQWTLDQGTGIVEGLQQSGFTKDVDYELETFYMDTRVTYTQPDQILERAALALDLIESFSPNIVFLTDDAALKEVGVVYTQQNPEVALPFIFSGINVDPTIYAPIASLDEPGGPITGALERIPYLQAFELAVKIFPDAASVVLLADGGTSSTAVVNAFQEEYLDVVSDSSLEVLDYIQPESFDEWKRTVEEYQDEVDILGILNFHQVRDDEGNIVPSQQVVDWMIENSSLPELGLVAGWTEDGLLSAAGNSGLKTGIYVGMLGVRVLNGVDPGSVPIVDPKVVDITFNLARAEMLGVDIPQEEIDKAAQVFEALP